MYPNMPFVAALLIGFFSLIIAVAEEKHPKAAIFITIVSLGYCAHQLIVWKLAGLI
jgi:hypothetical protein